MFCLSLTLEVTVISKRPVVQLQAVELFLPQ